MTDREKPYAEWVLDTHFEEQKPAMIDRNVITFVGEDGKQEFLAALQDEASYDTACGVRSVGGRLANKIKEL
jgi:hypothetical protein